MITKFFVAKSEKRLQLQRRFSLRRFSFAAVLVALVCAPSAHAQVDPQVTESGTGKPRQGYYTVAFAQMPDLPMTDPNSQSNIPQDSESLAREHIDVSNDDPVGIDAALKINDGDDDLDGGDGEPELLQDTNGDLDGDAGDRDEEDEQDMEDQAAPRPKFGVWPRKSIQEVRVNPIEYSDDVPADQSKSLFESSKRFGGDIAATEKVYAWAAPNIRYQPLYFEDVSLERYGQTKGLVKQPFVSAGKFLADGLLLWPRANRIHPKSCDSPLGFCRPGAPNTAQGCGCPNDSRSSCKSCQSCR